MTLAEAVAAVRIHDPKTRCLAQLISEKHAKRIKRLLVVGCGSGLEAAALSQELGCSVIGIDLGSNFDPAASAIVSLEVGDATALRFGNGSFDFVYSYHALEHIPDYRKALSEMNRVLANGGGYCVGTPNRSRLIGYLGSKDLTWKEKAQSNIGDWRDMLKGRFRNEFGAHAGFTGAELSVALVSAFGHATDISLDYYRVVYSRWKSSVQLLQSSGLGKLLFPSVYFVGTKADRASR